MGRMRSNESQSILKYTLLQERNSPGIGLRLDIGRPVLCRAQTHSAEPEYFLIGKPSSSSWCLHMFYQVLTLCKWFNRSSTTSQSILPVICQNKLTLRDRQLLNNMPGMCDKDWMRLGVMRSRRTWSIMSRSSRWTAVSSPRRWSPRGTWPRTSPSCSASTVQKLDIKKTLFRLYNFLVEGSTKFSVPYKLDDFLLFLHLVP